MTATAYRLCIQRLERVLSPRVASRTLQMGMQPRGLSPDTVTAEELEPILKGPVFKQLQVVMAPEAARTTVEEILGTMRRAEAPAEDGADGEDGRTADAGGGAADDAADGQAPAPAATDGVAERLQALRTALRPYNLYFEWPEVRRLRALLARLDQELASGGDGGSDLADEADEQLQAVAAKLEDMLVLQARDLAELEETAEELSSMGGPKVRRLEALIKHVRDAQSSRQLVDAEIERARRLARDLRKAMASSVYASGEGGASEAELDARMRALDLEAETQELDALARERALLLEHREDLAGRVQEARTRLEGGTSLGDALRGLRDELERAEAQLRQQIGEELTQAEATLRGLPDAAAADASRELDVLRAVLENGLPPPLDLVRLRDLLTLAQERAEREDRDAEADAREARARLDAQGERLTQARNELLLHDDDADGPLQARLREVTERLRLAQAEERADPEADADVRDALLALAGARADDGEGSEADERVRALMARLEGLPAAVDPEGAGELRRELEGWLVRPPDQRRLASGAAAVAELVASVQARVRARLDAAGTEAARWGLRDVLARVQAENERLEDGADPDLGGLERTLAEEREAARSEQLERLHAAEREADRLRGIDDAVEEELQEQLSRARTQLAQAEPATALDAAEERLTHLRDTLDRRIEDVTPRLDAAMASFRRVERLNSDEVATVRRILNHLDAERDAFARISPGMRARLERSLQEAEDLLGVLEEEERATRAIADRLMEAGRFDDVLGLFGGGDEAAQAAGTGVGPGDGGDGGGGGGDTADRWVRERTDQPNVTAAALVAQDGSVPAAEGVPRQHPEALAEAAGRLVSGLDDLGTALGLGAPLVTTIERSVGALVLAHQGRACAIVATDDGSTLGLLVRDLRDDRVWRDAVSSASRREADEGGESPRA